MNGHRRGIEDWTDWTSLAPNSAAKIKKLWKVSIIYYLILPYFFCFFLLKGGYRGETFLSLFSLKPWVQKSREKQKRGIPT